MSLSKVAAGKDGPQIWKVKVLNKQWQVRDNGWGVGEVLQLLTAER